jgi:hypothetical protein
MTHRQTKGYLGKLIQNGLAQFDSLLRFYYATSAGMDYLSAIDKMAEMLQLTTMRQIKEMLITGF